MSFKKIECTPCKTRHFSNGIIYVALYGDISYYCDKCSSYCCGMGRYGYKFYCHQCRVTNHIMKTNRYYYYNNDIYCDSHATEMNKILKRSILDPGTIYIKYSGERVEITNVVVEEEKTQTILHFKYLNIPIHSDEDLQLKNIILKMKLNHRMWKDLVR